MQAKKNLKRTKTIISVLSILSGQVWQIHAVLNIHCSDEMEPLVCRVKSPVQFLSVFFTHFFVFFVCFLSECNKWWLNLTEKTLRAYSNHNLNNLQNEHQKVVITITNQGHSSYIPGLRRHVYHAISWSNYCNSLTIWVEQCLTGSGKYV